MLRRGCARTGPETDDWSFNTPYRVPGASLCDCIRDVFVARAQEPPPSLAVTQVDATEYPVLRTIVTALDPRGVPAPGLTVADFCTSSSDVRVTGVEPAQDASLRLNVVLVIDTSGSMAGAPLAAAKAAASQFATSLGPNDAAGLVAFSGDVRPLVGFTSDAGALTAGIDGLTAAGNTALYDAVTRRCTSREQRAHRGGPS